MKLSYSLSSLSFFLRDWRVTLVPCIVIPVSLIGAFFRHVPGRFLHQRTFYACHRIVCGIGGG